MEIHVPGLTRAVAHLGTALEEVRSAIRPGEPGIVRIHTAGQAVELPIAFLVTGVLAAVLFLGTRGRGDRAIQFPPQQKLRDRTLAGRTTGGNA